MTAGMLTFEEVKREITASTIDTVIDQPAGYREVPFNVSHPKMFSTWHRLVPESQYWSPRLLHQRASLPS